MGLSALVEPRLTSTVLSAPTRSKSTSVSLRYEEWETGTPYLDPRPWLGEWSREDADGEILRPTRRIGPQRCRDATTMGHGVVGIRAGGGLPA